MSPKEQKAVTVSVVIPAYNEEGNISLLMVKLEQILDDFSYEILFVDDGSSDGTLERIKALGRSKPHLHYLSLSRNFGHQNALKAGLDHASGDCVITMDGDLQHHAPAPGYVSGFCHAPDRFHRRSEGGDRVPVYEQYG